MNKTQRRLRFLKNCIAAGMTKGRAAKELVKQDKSVSLAYARNLVYTYYSGIEPEYDVPNLDDDIL